MISTDPFLYLLDELIEKLLRVDYLLVKFHTIPTLYWPMIGESSFHAFEDKPLIGLLLMISKILVRHLMIIIKSEIWFAGFCLRLGHETLVSAACFTISLRMGNMLVTVNICIHIHYIYIWCASASQFHSSGIPPNVSLGVTPDERLTIRAPHSLSRAKDIGRTWKNVMILMKTALSGSSGLLSQCTRTCANIMSKYEAYSLTIGNSCSHVLSCIVTRGRILIRWTLKWGIVALTGIPKQF